MKSVRFALCTLGFAATSAVSVQAQEGDFSTQRVMTALPSLALEGHVFSTSPADIPIVPIPRAPAPALSSVRVYAVGSTACGWEYTNGNSGTTCNHGGGELRVAIVEIGYGTNPIASMNGGQLPRSARYASTGICITGTQYTWPCTPGQTVVGWLDEYNVDGHESGYFQYQNTSTNAPYNTLYTQINIL